MSSKKTASPLDGVPLPAIDPKAQRKQIQDRNIDRDPERLAMKYAKMKSSAFVFLRGASALYFDALPDVHSLTKAPLAWCCGDLHFENMGSYEGSDGQPYFDLNDFDEASLAPCTWDIVRLLSSLICAATALKADALSIKKLTYECLDGYRDALRKGKPLAIDVGNAAGMFKALLDTVEDRKRSAFLNRRTKLKNDRRQIRIDGIKALPVTAKEREQVEAFMVDFAKTQPDPSFFEVIDVARRIAGTGSLGLMRYVILVTGKGSPNHNYLLDLKAAQGSALTHRLEKLGIKQPTWSDEATRCVTVQNRMQASTFPFITPTNFHGQSCVFRRLHPSEDRLSIEHAGPHLEHLLHAARSMGQISAWDQLRASGRQGSASADELIAFGENGVTWFNELNQAAFYMAAVTELQWQAFLDCPPKQK